MHKAKLFYFTVFILTVFAFVFHVTAMGHHHWKKAIRKDGSPTSLTDTTIGLFTRCTPITNFKGEQCFPNLYPMNDACISWLECQRNNSNQTCQCDYSPSTKGIASCAIIASIFLGISIIILFIHSINTSETRSLSLLLSFIPLFSTLMAFIFILITLILVGSYLSRDIMHIIRAETGT